MKVLRRQQLTCPVTGKAAFVTKERALEVVERLKNADDWVDEHGGHAKNVYRCRECRWWHLTKGKSG